MCLPNCISFKFFGYIFEAAKEACGHSNWPLSWWFSERSMKLQIWASKFKLLTWTSGMWNVAIHNLNLNATSMQRYQNESSMQLPGSPRPDLKLSAGKRLSGWKFQLAITAKSRFVAFLRRTCESILLTNSVGLTHRQRLSGCVLKSPLNFLI